MPPAARHIYLASRSARRRELLKQIGVVYEMLLLRESPNRAADFDETPLAGESPKDYVLRVAQLKVDTGWARLTQRRLMRMPVLSADTTVAVGDRILGKPADRNEATDFLQQLSGKTHLVLSAVAIRFDNQLEVALSSTEVQFRDLETHEIAQYVASGEPNDKAGAYGIQGRAAVFIQSISGSYTGVMGLPLFETSELLAKFGITTF